MMSLLLLPNLSLASIATSMINNGFMLRILQKRVIRDVINNLKSMK
jgi:hypothetical protein